MKQSLVWFKKYIGTLVSVQLPDSEEVTTITWYTTMGAQAHFELQKKGFRYSVNN